MTTFIKKSFTKPRCFSSTSPILLIKTPVIRSPSPTISSSTFTPIPLQKTNQEIRPASSTPTLPKIPDLYFRSQSTLPDIRSSPIFALGLLNEKRCAPRKIYCFEKCLNFLEALFNKEIVKPKINLKAIKKPITQQISIYYDYLNLKKIETLRDYIDKHFSETTNPILSNLPYLLKTFFEKPEINLKIKDFHSIFQISINPIPLFLRFNNYLRQYVKINGSSKFLLILEFNIPGIAPHALVYEINCKKKLHTTYNTFSIYQPGLDLKTTSKIDINRFEPYKLLNQYLSWPIKALHILTMEIK